MLDNLIIPTLNRYDLLDRLLESIDYPVAHLLIIDNGGKYSLNVDDIPELVEQVTILNMPANLGVASSWNLGIKSFPYCDRWFIASDDMQFEPGGLELLHRMSGSDKMLISDEWPHFQFFAIGEEFVGVVGLFDEAIHPANFEDDEYRWRAETLGFQIDEVEIPHSHVQQGTVFHKDFEERIGKAYTLNESYLDMKKRNRDYTDGFWMLSRRRLCGLE